jgi:hypothetical protein
VVFLKKNLKVIISISIIIAIFTIFSLNSFALDSGYYRIQQKSNSRYLDAHESSTNDFNLVTRLYQSNDTQVWRITNYGSYYRIQQKSNSRYLDAHENSTNDYRVVTREYQNNDTQKWCIYVLGNGAYRILQISNGRYLDAHENSTNDYRVVTRGYQTNTTQEWIITK